MKTLVVVDANDFENFCAPAREAKKNYADIFEYGDWRIEWNHENHSEKLYYKCQRTGFMCRDGDNLVFDKYEEFDVWNLFPPGTREELEALEAAE